MHMRTYYNGDGALRNLDWLPSKEILICDEKTVYNKQHDQNDVDVASVRLEKIIYIKPTSIIKRVKDEKLEIDENISTAEENHSDLIPSLYEGGLKVWECTYDIANYLERSQVSCASVLDLGCGVGLLGILALKLGADQVYFQDYNADVLKYATIPNLQLNAEPNQLTRCRFFSGDWESFAKLADFTCDLIVSSETIYNPDNYLKLHDTIQRLLKPSGTALVGAKSYYFGVGGSTRQFEKLVKERDVFDVEVVWRCSQGVQREILKLTVKDKST
ncbi:histidine protein methyltransferase 1 homolog isoform X2 [Homalodisca vitripennis]|uniref:histidine protein methyltransferase 1 homolog isoform X2 n=1 Tax=Homalodisca vitripennis TaxID=197043 RepID=UPI001EECAC0B|nr:histidine protein methyltransferase 1 homolog isoform X2 [Homalodisca vitripennis]